MKKIIPSVAFTILLMAAQACNLPGRSEPSPSPSPIEQGASFTATNTAEPTQSPTPPTPTDLSTQTPEPTLTIVLATPASPAPTPGAPMDNLPGGFVCDPDDGASLVFYNRGGNSIGKVIVSGPRGGAPDYVHVAGRLSDDPASIPVIYFSYEEMGQLKVSQRGEANRLVTAPFFVGLAGAPGQPILAFTTAEWQGNALLSQLFIGSLETIANAQAAINESDPESWALKPLAVSAEAGEPAGVWYTIVAYGIGGDVVFEPRAGLYYLDLQTEQIREVLGKDAGPSGISPDRTWLAYTLHGEIKGFSPASLVIRNLETGENFTFPRLPESDRGAGNAVFSPDNRYVAWMEGSGRFLAEPPNYHATIRIATTTGSIVATLPDTLLADILSTGIPSWVKPVGWLDRVTLLLQLRTEDWQSAGLVRVQFDGSNPTYLAPGNFAGFFYP